MPAWYSLRSTVAGVDPRVVAVRYWLYPSVTNQSAELPNTVAGFQQCRYMLLEGWDQTPAGQNPRGTLIITTHIDTRLQSVFDYYHADVNQADAVETLLRGAFPDPGQP